MTTKSKRVTAGEVLTVALLKKLNKRAYQFGGLLVDGEITKQTIFEICAKTNRTAVVVESSDIKGNIDSFITNFEKTMSASIYQLKII